MILDFLVLFALSSRGHSAPCQGNYGVVTAQDHFVLTEFIATQKNFNAVARVPKKQDKVSGQCEFGSQRGVFNFTRSTGIFTSQKFQGSLVQGPFGFEIGGTSEVPWRGYQLASDKIINVATPAQVGALRTRLYQLFWKQDGLPVKKQPDRVQKNAGAPFALTNLASVDMISVNTAGFRSHAFLFHPVNPKNKAVIFHQGHDEKLEAAGGGATIQTFLNLGYDVLAFYMPLFGPNTGPLNFGRGDHRKIINDLIGTSNYPLTVFIEPVVVGVNYLIAQGKYFSISMVGISGGGWTTTVAAALDPRILRSFPVAGSMPFSWKQQRDWGDSEQFEPSFLQLASFTDLYVLGSVGEERRQVQIHNELDECCFAIDHVPSFVGMVQKQVSLLGFGSYQFFVNPAQRNHEISARALQEHIVPNLN